MSGLNNKQFFLIVLESAKSKIKELADVVSGEGPLSDLQMAAFSLYLLHIMDKEIISFLMRALVPA